MRCSARFIHSAGLGCLVLLFSACATRGASEAPGPGGVYSESQLDERMRGDCPRNASGVGSRPVAYVPVEFVVGEDGRVQMGSPRALGRLRWWLPPVRDRWVYRAYYDLRAREQELRARAEQAARSCRFEVPRRGGEPVAVRLRHYFAFDH